MVVRAEGFKVGRAEGFPLGRAEGFFVGEREVGPGLGRLVGRVVGERRVGEPEGLLVATTFTAVGYEESLRMPQDPQTQTGALSPAQALPS